MTLIASDGYEYEDLTQRLLGNPKDSHRNEHIRNVRRLYPQNEARAFEKAYDQACGTTEHKHSSAWRALAAERDRTRDPAR